MAIFGGLSLATKSRFPETETAECRDWVRMRRLLRRKAEHLVLARPFSRRIGEASNSHSMRELARDSCFDEIGREEGKRDRHIHLADAAALTLRNGFRGCRRIRGKLGEPTTSPDNRRDQCGARFRPDRTGAFRAPRVKDEYGAYKVFAKTRGPIDQAILGGYRHEFGSLPRVEENAEFRALPDDWREGRDGVCWATHKKPH